MKRFHFRLERLLEIRAFRERQWLARLAEASGHCVRVARQIQANGEARREAFAAASRRRDGQGRELDLRLLAYREQYLTRLGVEMRRLSEELKDRTHARDEVEKQYVEVSRQRKVLDKLKERRQAEYYAHGRREEFKTQDDLSCDRFLRGREP